MISIDISADTQEEALEDGLQQLGIPSAAVDVQVLSSAHDDILPGAEPLPGVTIRLTVKEDVLIDDAREYLTSILELMGVDAQIEVFRRRGGVALNIRAGADDSLIIGKNGQNLEAIQIIVNRMVVHGGRDLVPIFVDCEGYMEKRLSRLESLAKRSAKRAARDGVEVPLEVMTSFERKIVHNTLKEIHGIHTLSRGDGMERHIVIIPDEGSIDRQLRPKRGAPTGGGNRRENDTARSGDVGDAGDALQSSETVVRKTSDEDYLG